MKERHTYRHHAVSVATFRHVRVGYDVVIQVAKSRRGSQFERYFDILLVGRNDDAHGVIEF